MSQFQSAFKRLSTTLTQNTIRLQTVWLSSALFELFVDDAFCRTHEKEEIYDVEYENGACTCQLHWGIEIVPISCVAKKKAQSS